MRILIATASKHSATREIGDRLRLRMADRFAERGIAAQIDVRDADDISDYDAAVVGSAVYFGRWLKSARRLVDRFEVTVDDVPVWIFSTGPTDDDRPSTDAQAPHWVRGQTTFGGKLDRATLSRTERAVVAVLHAPDADRRDWQAVDEWATEIADAL